MKRGLGFTAALVALVLVLAAAGAGETGGGLIVFPATPAEGGATQLFAVEPSGANLTQLTTGSYPALYPAFSPSGKRLAFARFGVGIFTMNPDGTGLRRLTKGARDAFPTWSPDGKRIVFVRPLGHAWRLYSLPSSGGKEKRLPKSPPAGRPTWTKKGLLVPTGGDLLRVDVSTGRVLKYYDAEIDAIWGLNSVTIAPGVSNLTFVGTRDPIPGDMECGDGPCQRFGLYLESLTAKKKRAKLIVKDAGPAAFAPNGRRIVYVGGGALTLRDVGSGVSVTIPLDGPAPVTTGPPAWR